MQRAAVPGLTLVRVRTDAELEDMITVRALENPDRPPPRLENLRHNLDSEPELRYVVARLGDAPVGCGFVEPTPAEFARGHLVVVPAARGRGVGSALLSEVSRRAAELGKRQLEGEVTESDAASRAFFERRRYTVVGGEQAVALDLTALEPRDAAPPDGVRIVSRAERPDLLDGMYEVSLEAERDIPDFAGERSFEAWRATDVDRPSLRPELSFVALAGDEVVGFASLHDYGRDAHNSLTAVKPAWRRRGVATALKRTQIAAAKEHGFRRLLTESETRNTPMRALEREARLQARAEHEHRGAAGPARLTRRTMVVMATTEDRRETESGIELKPVYMRGDVAADPEPPGEFPYTRGPYPDMYRGPTVDDPPVRRLRFRGGDELPVPLPARARADRSVGRVRPADAARLRLRRSASRRRGGADGCGDRLARRHAVAASTRSRSARSRLP